MRSDVERLAGIRDGLLLLMAEAQALWASLRSDPDTRYGATCCTVGGLVSDLGKALRSVSDEIATLRWHGVTE
jgi:hypothetical protein